MNMETFLIIGFIVLTLLVCGLHVHLVAEINKVHTAFVSQPSVATAIADVKSTVARVEGKADVLVDKAKNALTGAALDAAKKDAQAAIDKLKSMIEGSSPAAEPPVAVNVPVPGAVAALASDAAPASA